MAMKLHTREQAPKEGQAEAPKPMSAWVPTREGYAKFLSESRVVYEAFEGIMKAASHKEYALFQHTGLERTQPLNEDLAWFKATYNITPPTPAADGAGHTYRGLIERLAVDDPPAFICHYYNYYFAHTAGGRMIGNKLSAQLLDGAQLKFYQYEGDMNELLDGVRTHINQLAESWTPEQKKHCLAETASSFQFSGGVMRCISE